MAAALLGIGATGYAVEPTSGRSRGANVAPTASAPASCDGPSGGPAADSLETDRPDFTECASVVSMGRVQLESGYTVAYDREHGVRRSEQTFPELLLRAGIAERLELRVGWAGLSYSEELFREKNDAGRTVSRNPHDRGATDLYLGFKHALTRGEGPVSLALIPALTVPSGSAGKSSGDVDPEMKLAWELALAERVGLAGNVNIGVPTDERGRFVQTAASITVGVEWTPYLSSYVEYFGIYPNERGADAAHYLDGGLAIPISADVQLDLRAGVGLNEEADDLFVGAGISVRW